MPDDFPALGGGGSQQQQNQQNQQHHHHPHQAQNQNQSSAATGSNGANGGGDASSGSHPPGLNGFETRQTLPPGLLSLTGAQRSMVAADAEKRATSKLSTWSQAGAVAATSSGNGAASQQQQQANGTSLNAQPPLGSAGVPTPGVPSPYPQQSTGAGEGLQPSSANATNSAVPQTPAQQILMSAADRWGLLGLLTSIKNADPDQNLLTIGTDLGTMGLDMQTQGCVCSFFLTLCQFTDKMFSFPRF